METVIEDSVLDIIEKVANEVCDNLCKYQETADDNFVCDYMRQGKMCPLERLR